MDKETVKSVLKELETKTQLLNLSRHKALGDWVIVAPANIREEGITSRAVQFEERPEVGLIVSVGPLVGDIEPGDIVFFGKYSHVQVTHDDINYLIMRQEDIYCVAKDE
jgi:co-chaperonin GroES (HSP10)